MGQDSSIVFNFNFLSNLVSNMNNYTIEQEKKVWVIKIYSPRKIGAMIIIAIWATLLLLALIIIPFVPISSFLEAMLAVLVAGFFILFLYRYLNAFFYLYRGYETLIIPVEDATVFFARKGVFYFQTKLLLFSELSYIGLREENKLPYDSPHSRFNESVGFSGGPLLILYAGKKGIEFGNSLGIEERNSLSNELQSLIDLSKRS